MSDTAATYDLVITGSTVLQDNVGKTPRFEAGTTIAVSDGRIAYVGPDDPSIIGKEVVSANGLVAIPGLINCHSHAAMTLFRGVAEDVPVHSWFNKYVWPMEVNLTEEDVYLGTLLACAEMLSSGVTSFADHYFYMDAAARAVDESGIRANLGWAFFSSMGPEGLEQSADFAERLNGGAGGRITTSLAPHAPYTVNDADLAAAAEHAKRIGVRVHIHAAENLAQTESSLQAHGVTPIEILHRTGILEAGTIIAHGCGITEADIPILAEYRDAVGVAHCPKVYLKHALPPLTPIRSLDAAGVPVGMGTDGVAGNNTLDILESMRLTAMTQKYVEADATWLTTGHAINLATTQSAQTYGLADDIGSLEVGKRADIALLEMSGTHWQPIHDVAAALVYSARAGDVVTVVSDGSIVVKDRKLLTIDVAAITDELNERLERLIDVTHGDQIQRYDP
jgi:5-methylthioadenosine/S-adenosylhomocysteine deaminase